MPCPNQFVPPEGETLSIKIYPLGEMESVEQSSYPGKILDLALERNIINPTQYDAIWEDNVIQWLCGDNQETKDKLVKRILS